MTFKLWLAVIAHFKAVGLPEVISGKSLAGVVPRNLRYRTRLSLRSLKLITDDGRVLNPFRQLVKTWDSPVRQDALKGLARDAYPYLHGIALSALNSDQLRKAFVFHVGRDTPILAKSEMFFLNLANAAGLELSEELQKRVASSEARGVAADDAKTTVDTSVPTKGKTATQRKTAMKPNEKTDLTAQERVEKIMDILRMFSGEGLPAKELAALVTLLDYAKRTADVA